METGRNRSPFNRNLTVRKGRNTRKKEQRVSREALRFDKHRNDRVTCLARLNYAPRGPATGITPALCQDVSATGWQNESPNDLSNHRGRPTAKNYQKKREVKGKRREREEGKKGEKKWRGEKEKKRGTDGEEKMASKEKEWKRKGRKSVEEKDREKERERRLRGGLQFSRFTFFSITGARVPLYSR